MTEQINKQCPFCGEYIPIDSTVCKYCEENLTEESENNINNETIQKNPETENCETSGDYTEEKSAKSNSNKVKKYIIITSLTFIIGILLVLAILYIINRNTDVTIAPKDKTKISVPKFLDNKTSAEINQAKTLYKDGKLEEAAEIFQKEIDAKNDPVAYYYMGEIYNDQSFTKIAISNYKSALNYKKDFYEPLKRLADIYVQKNENDTALEYADKALKQKPKDVELLKTIVQIHNNLGNDDKVLQTYKKIVQIDKKDYDSNSYIAYHHYNKDEYKEAIPYFQNLLAIEYNTRNAYALAISYSNIEYYTKAMEVLNLIIKNDPYEYNYATYAKSRLSDMKDYYNATHQKQRPTKPTSQPNTKESYDEEAEDTLF